MALKLRTSPLRAKVIVVPPIAYLGFEINSSEASAGRRKRLVNFRVILIWFLFSKKEKRKSLTEKDTTVNSSA